MAGSGRQPRACAGRFGSPGSDAGAVGTVLPAVEASTEGGQQAGVCVRQAVEAVAVLFRDLEDELGRLDVVAGDDDHGRGMAARLGGRADRGDRGVRRRQRRPDGAAERRRGVGRQGRRHVRRSLGCETVGRRRRLPSDAVPTDADVVAGVVGAWQQVKAIGGAEVGDKTLVDALEPFAVTLRERFDGGDDLRTLGAQPFPRLGPLRPRPPTSPPGWAAPASWAPRASARPTPAPPRWPPSWERSRQS